MDNLLNLVLEAHNDEHNHHRRYEFTVGKDLFDEWTLTINYGRTGQQGQSQRFSSMNPEKLRKVIAERIRRRENAPKRIGCVYRLAAFSTSHDVNPIDWLPNNVAQKLRF